VHIGRVLIEKKYYRDALVYLDSGLYVIELKKVVFTDFFNPLDEIYEVFALAYEGLGDYKKAYHYYTLFHEIQEKKQLQQKGQSLSQLQSTYTFKQKQSELDLLHKINEANLTIITQQHYAQIASLIVIAILAALALFVYRISKQRKKLNIELKAANTELERLNATKDKLFSVVSHDLRGPLLNLRAMIGLLNAGHIEPGEFNQFIEKINQQLIASGSALDNLLHWAKSQLSDMKLRPESLLINKKVDKVIQGLMTEAKKKEIDLINEVPIGLTAFADKNQIEIVLRNLINNALKFTGDKGFVKIGGTRVNDELVEIFVEDNGIGMESKDIERLFQPGKQFTRTGTHDEKGTGIGLIITKEMVKANGGDIRVTSEKGKGSKFAFTLPSK
jgi:signal transduction histidine kinase